MPDLTPTATAFYQRLLAGELDYRVMARFKTYPSLLGITFRDDAAELSFIGYDHPAVYVLERESPQAVKAGLETMAAALDQDRNCSDAALRDVATALLAEDFPSAEERLRPLTDNYPHSAIVPFLQAEVYLKTDRPEEEPLARDRYKAMSKHRAAHVLPWAAAMGLVDLESRFAEIALFGRIQLYLGNLVGLYPIAIATRRSPLLTAERFGKTSLVPKTAELRYSIHRRIRRLQ